MSDPGPDSSIARRQALLGSHPLLEALFDALPVGVVLLDRAGRVVLYNRYEERLARRRRQDVVGRRFFEEVAPCTDVRELAGAFRERIADDALDVTVDFAFKLAFLPRPREVRIVLRSFPLEGDTFAAFVVEDRTERLRLERERDAFASVLVHDLRGDLAGVLGYAALLREGALGPLAPMQQDAAVKLHDAARALDGRIDAALDAFRLRRKGAAPRARRDPINLHALVIAAVSLLRPLALERGVALDYVGWDPARPFPDRAVAVAGDEERLAAVVENLLGNALKYARARVLVELTTGPAGVVLAVGDDGPGVAPGWEARVLEGERPPGSKPGHGLGLVSTRQTAEAHGGRVLVGRSALGGARIEVTLPGAPAGDAEPAPAGGGST